MQRYKQKKKPSSTKPANFDLLLQDIRSKLGPDWTFFQECVEGAIGAAAREQDVSAWLEQMEQLVEGRDDLAFSHQGVLFLLAEMRVKARSEGRMSQCSHYHDNNNDNNQTEYLSPVPSTNMPPPPLPLRILDPPRLSTTQPTPTSDMQPFANYLPSPIPKLPFSFNTSKPSTPSSATFPPQPTTPNIAFFGATRLDNNTPSPLNLSANPVFFSDPAFKRDVQNFFGSTHPSNSTSKHMTSYYDHNELTPPYKASDDDLKVWKERVERDREGKGVAVQGESERGERVVQWEKECRKDGILDDE